MRYNRLVVYKKLSRRRFLAFAACAAGAAGAGFAPPTPLAPTVTTTETPEYFVPLEHYHELPPECYSQNLIRPIEIILHWDGNSHARELWVTAVTFQTLAYHRASAHFAVDHRRVWQMLPMYRSLVQEAHGAQGYNWSSIHIEMAGTEFDLPDNYPPENEIRLTVLLVSQLMDYYAIAYPQVVGHYERDNRGLKRDPGIRFMGDFRERLGAYRDSLSPVKRQHLAG